ncbi:MAG: sugar transporter permease [Herbinix sp.]|jgi:raffinose/stachyose/melibiose transport system permease protein|nr:sugar transporter permease [Herbinix sp.]
MKSKISKLGLPILFLAPVILIYSIFVFLPMISSLYYSFTEWNGVTEKVFVGFQNYKSLFEDSDYWVVFINTIKLVVITLVVQIPMGLILAFLLYSKTKGMKVFRTIFFLPVVIAPVAIALMFSLFYNSEIGIFNIILEAVGLGMLKKNWLSDTHTLLYAVMAPQVWQYIGLYVTIFLGALQSIPEELMESAQIDGANKFKTFVHIILPQISGFTSICTVLCITGSLKAFDHSWIMTGGGPGVRSAYLGVYMYKTAFVNSDFGLGSTITITIITVSLIITGILGKITTMRSNN